MGETAAADIDLLLEPGGRQRLGRNTTTTSKSVASEVFDPNKAVCYEAAPEAQPAGVCLVDPMFSSPKNAVFDFGCG